MAKGPCGTTGLRFLTNRLLQGPLVEPLDVWTRGGKRIGSFDGVVIDPDGFRARYLVVDRSRLYPDRCLIPLPAHLDLVNQALRVDVDEGDWLAFDPANFSRFASDDESTATVVRRA